MKSFIISCCMILLIIVGGSIESKAQCNPWPVPCGNCICVCTVSCSCSTICPKELSSNSDQKLYDSLFNVLSEGEKASKIALNQKQVHEIAHRMNAIIEKDTKAFKQPNDRKKSHIGEKK